MGSKRLKRKNILPINGKPMINCVIEQALKSKYITTDNLYISSESLEVKNVIPHDVKFLTRPHNLANDSVGIQPVINNVIKILSLQPEDIVIILQPNCPQLTGQLIDECVEKLITNDLWQVHTTTNNIHNGAIHVMKVKASHACGKVSYNGFVDSNILEIHNQKELDLVEQLCK